jgi:RNA polymerase sigma-70 factor (sigma-E family)
LNETAEADFRSFTTDRWPKLLKTAYLLTGHHHDAEDLVQAALARAYVKWETVRRANDPDAYVWRILINTNLDRIRRMKAREWLTTFFPERAAADRAEEFADRDVLVTALLRLPPRQRAAVVLRYVEDRTETEVARLLGTKVGTVRSQVAKGLDKLREDGAVCALRAGV